MTKASRKIPRNYCLDQQKTRRAEKENARTQKGGD